MGYRLKGAMKKSKRAFIIGFGLWILLSIVFAIPLAVSIIDATEDGFLGIQALFDKFLMIVGDFSVNIRKAFMPAYIKTFAKTEAVLGGVILFLATIGFIKAIPKNEYTDIEHGSSDWAKGEEYKVLSRRKGIILAEKHYLPVNKRGNVNVLVVGRFRFW